MSKITEFVKANKKATVIGAIVLVLVIVGVAVALTTGDKKGSDANGTKTENSQSATTDKKNDGQKEDAGTSNGGGLQVVDPTKDDVKEDSVDVSDLFEDDNKDDNKDDSKNDNKDDNKDDSKNDDKDDQWGAFY